jgi:hypothetical protein
MPDSVPSRQDIDDTWRRLVNGDLSPDEVSVWAQSRVGGSSDDYMVLLGIVVLNGCTGNSLKSNARWARHVVAQYAKWTAACLQHDMDPEEFVRKRELESQCPAHSSSERERLKEEARGRRKLR